jgi:hypothetical protein
MSESPSVRPIVATWMYSAPDGDESMHHQVGKAIGTQKTRNYYWRCVFVLFASAALHLPSSRRILIVNRMPPESIDGIAIAPLLDRFQIEIRVLDEVTRPGKDYHSSWNTQFIVIDALQILSEIATGDEPVLLLDSDCVFVRPLSEEITQRIKRWGVLRYTLHDDDDVKENGLSNRDLGRLAAEYTPPLTTERIRYAGGEIFCGRADMLPQVLHLSRAAFARSIERHSAGLPKFNEEAHLLSYVYEVLNAPDHTANDFIKRIWTDRGVHSNIDGTEDKLTIWHLPAEKKAGILRMFTEIGRGKPYPNSLAECARTFRISPTSLDLILMQLKRGARLIRDRLKKIVS